MNSIPDFEEPFLRFSADRPEFLFGVDMNNNFWVDLYENDDQPDYPYPIDHRGANMYIGLDAAAGLRLSVGALREESISTDRHNHSTYAVVNYDGESARYGRLRVFEMSKLVEDDIANPLLQWVPDTTIRGGRVTAVDDPLLGRGHVGESALPGAPLRDRLPECDEPAQLGVLSAAHEQISRAAIESGWDGFLFRRHQQGELPVQTRAADSRAALEERVPQADAGIVRRPGAHQSDGAGFGLVTVPVLRASQLQAGVEYVYFNDVDRDAEDFDSISYALQFSTSSEYLGYRIQTLAGAVIERKDFEGQEATTTTQSFITVYADSGNGVGSGSVLLRKIA